MATIDTMPAYWSVKDTADFLGLSKHTVYRMIDSGEIPCTSYGKNGRTKRIPTDKLIAWADARTTKGQT